MLFLLGQGVKACPFVDMSAVSKPHCKPTTEDLLAQMQEKHSRGMFNQSTHVLILRKTVAYFMGLQRQGCGFPPCEQTNYNTEEIAARDSLQEARKRERRGHDSKPTCDGRLLYKIRQDGRPYIW